MNITQTIDSLRTNALTFSSRPGKLETLHEMVQRVEAAQIRGIFLEAGVAMGGSAIVITQTKNPARELRLYDVFEMMPPPGDDDDSRSHEDHARLISGSAEGEAARQYTEHSGDLLGFTRDNMRRFGIDPEAANISFFKGRYEKTLTVEEPVAFAHIDCDWYASVKLCIDRIVNQVSVGGIMLFDDYAVYGGCRKAVHEWLARDDRFLIIHAGRTLAVERIG